MSSSSTSGTGIVYAVVDLFFFFFLDGVALIWDGPVILRFLTGPWYNSVQFPMLYDGWIYWSKWCSTFGHFRYWEGKGWNALLLSITTRDKEVHGSRIPSAYRTYTQASSRRLAYHLHSHIQNLSFNDLTITLYTPSLPITAERSFRSGYIDLRLSQFPTLSLGSTAACVCRITARIIIRLKGWRWWFSKSDIRLCILCECVCC